MAEDTLTFRQRMFVEAYLGEANGNATEAARLAGYASPHPEGSRLLHNATIQAAVSARVESAAMSANEVLARLSDQASVDLADFLDISDGEATSSGTEEPIRVNLRKAKRAGRTHLVKELKPTEYGISIKLCDSQAALEKLGKYHRLFTDKIDVTSNGQTVGTVTWDEIETGLMDVLATYPDARVAVADYFARLVSSRTAGLDSPKARPKPAHDGPGVDAGPVAEACPDLASEAATLALLPPVGQEHGDGGEGTGDRSV